MLSITKTFRAINANFSYRNGAKTHFIHLRVEESVIHNVGNKQTRRLDLNHSEFTQVFVELFSGCGVFSGQCYEKKIKIKTEITFIKQRYLSGFLLFLLLTNQFFDHSS